EYCYVLNTRQMGKSSLMIRAAARLREGGVAIAILDLTAIGQNLTPEQWYDGLLLSLASQLDLEEELERFWDENRRLGPLQRFMAAIERCVVGSVGRSGGERESAKERIREGAKETSEPDIGS